MWLSHIILMLYCLLLATWHVDYDIQNTFIVECIFRLGVLKTKSNVKWAWNIYLWLSKGDDLRSVFLCLPLRAIAKSHLWMYFSSCNSIRTLRYSFRLEYNPCHSFFSPTSLGHPVDCFIKRHMLDRQDNVTTRDRTNEGFLRNKTWWLRIFWASQYKVSCTTQKVA